MEDEEYNKEKREFFYAIAKVFLCVGIISLGALLLFPENVSLSHFIGISIGAAMFAFAGYVRDRTWYMMMVFLCPAGALLTVASMAFDPPGLGDWAAIGIYVWIFLDAMKKIRKRS